MEYYTLRNHIGHRVEIVGDGDAPDYASVSIKCQTCGATLIEYDGVLFFKPEDLTNEKS